MPTLSFSLRGVREHDDFEMLRRAVMDLPGVSDVDINPGAQELIVTFDEDLVSRKDIAETISIIGYRFS